MKIRKEDYQDTLNYLIKNYGEGKEYIAFINDFAPVGKEDLFAFSSHYDAQEFCYEMSTDIDTYDCLAIRSVYKAMTEAIKNNYLMIEKDGIVDIGLMLYQRLEAEKLNNNLKSNIMNQKNFDYLKDQIKYTGFGENLEAELKQKIQEGKTEFKLKHETVFGNDKVEAVLNFSKSKQSDMYFFNTYQASILKENEPESMTQTFYINKANNITLKEAYNLMEGRSVNKDLTNKEGQLYNAWVQMDFKQSDDKGNFKLQQYHQNYGYDLETVLSKHSIKELSNSDFKEGLMDSLKKGNRQSVTFLNNGAEQKQYIEANPQFKTINIYDSNMQRLGSRQSKEEKQSEQENQSAKQNNRQQKATASEDDSPEVPKASNKKRKRQVQHV